MVHADVVAAYKNRMVLNTLAGIGLVVFGALLLTRLPPLSPFVVFAGVYLTAKSFSALTRLWAIERELIGSAQSEFYDEVHRATIPRQVFLLLLAVAEADRAAQAAEREMVRRFLIERFSGPISAFDLADWENQRVPRNGVQPLARRVGQILSEPERVTLFHWACHVAFADGHFQADEHTVLQDVAKGLGLSPEHARRIFHSAKAEYLGAYGQRHQRDEQRRAPRPDRRVTSRARALEVLGLDQRADAAQIRKRHRELAKKYHPDAHIHLGEVAAREASERFREIQSAYEVLRTAAS